MAEEKGREAVARGKILTKESVRREIVRYSRSHHRSNDDGEEGRYRIPMKKLMKIFEIKKNAPAQRRNLFREIMNDVCELELVGEIGKVLVLKRGEEPPGADDVVSSEDEELLDSGVPTAEELGYGQASPTAKTNAGDGKFSETPAATDKRPARQRRGYMRRGSVTRYSIVAQDAVAEEYKKHEDVIDRFRRVVVSGPAV